MQLSTPCPRCQAPITLRQVLLTPSPLHFKCAQCQVQLHLKPWAWGVTIGFFAVVLAAVGLFLYQRVAADIAVRGPLRIVMLGFLVLALVINLLMLQLRPFYVRDGD